MDVKRTNAESDQSLVRPGAYDDAVMQLVVDLLGAWARLVESMTQDKAKSAEGESTGERNE